MSGAHHRAETPYLPQVIWASSHLLISPYIVVTCESFCCLAIYTEIGDLWNVQVFALEGFSNELLRSDRLNPLIL